MSAADQIRFDDPQASLQRLTARFGGHAYDLHRHETYAVGLTLWGAQSFHYRGALRTSRGGQVMVIHPDEAHDGHATLDAGFAYRMLYIEPALVSQALGGAPPPYVPDVVADDAVLAALLAEAFADFPRPLEPLAADAIVERLATRLASRGDGRPPRRPQPAAQRAVARARDYLAAEAQRTVASHELEAVTGLDRFTLARQFRALTGTSPHRWQVGRRLARAQAMIAAGTSLSEAAAETGFADQSHLTRHFVARFGLTPGRFAALARGRRSPRGTGR
ncbi:MAG: helix-turn-helix domain-containing protein [Pseudomonadota bacterium]